MKAIGLFEYGGPEVLRLVELPEPDARGGEVRVKVRAAAINPADVMLREGLLRASYEGIEPPFVPGMEVAGTIDEVGEGVSEAAGVALAEDVVGFVDNNGRHGGYSEYVVLPAASVTRMPAGATFAQAASFLMNALTARTALDVLVSRVRRSRSPGAPARSAADVVQLAAAAGLRVHRRRSAARRGLDPLVRCGGCGRPR
jgi:NADPH:quinone reductase